MMLHDDRHLFRPRIAPPRNLYHRPRYPLEIDSSLNLPGSSLVIALIAPTSLDYSLSHPRFLSSLTSLSLAFLSCSLFRELSRRLKVILRARPWRYTATRYGLSRDN
eukprot:738249-Amorphochlora_amoeboformis.AAC.1